MYPENAKKPGRPPLSPEEREARRKAKNKRDNERKKAQGYTAQKRYRENRKGQVYEPKLVIPASKKSVLFELMEKTGMTTTQLFVTAVEEKYGVDLHTSVSDNT